MATEQLTAEDRKQLRGRVVVASLSGGKDSTAMALYLLDQGVEFRAVWMDTGWEHPETVRYVTEVLPAVIGQPVEVLRPKYGMAELISRKGMFPGRLHRYCTQELKIRPFETWIEEQFAGLVPVNAVGVRAAESKARSDLPRWSVEGGLDAVVLVWRPLLDWTTEDVIEIHRRHGVRPNPLYLTHNVSRVGCWPCIFARKAEVATVALHDSARIDLIRALEAEAQGKAAARYAARGETFESLGYKPPTFFAMRRKGEKKNSNVPIDEVVEWAQTGRGSLAEIPRDDGCVRWGMCDVPLGGDDGTEDAE